MRPIISNRKAAEPGRRGPMCQFTQHARVAVEVSDL